MSRLELALASSAFILLGSSSPAAASAPARADTDVPVSIQIPAFLKALSYEESLTVSRSTVLVLVVYDPEQAPSLEARDRVLEVQSQLTRMRVKGKPVDLRAVPYRDALELGAAAVLVTPLDARAADDVSRRARAAGLVTLAMTPEAVERHGLVLGMESREGKPRFIVNLEAAQAVGATFESSFLDLCRVVER